MIEKAGATKDLSYYRRALADELETIAENVEEGDRNHQLFLSACNVFGLVKARLASRPDAEDALLSAADASGYADDDVLVQGIERQTVAFIAKPFANHELLHAVRNALDRVAEAPNH